MKQTNRTLLAVLAHPDDESFGMGGTLALYARRGVAVHLVCATRGEAGEVSPEMLEGFESIADLRERELFCAAEKLRLSGVHFLGYRDSGMPGSPANGHPEALVNAPLDEVAGKIVKYMRQLRPQVVITFDPIGGYRHPDHIAVHQATVHAFELSGDSQVITAEYLPFRPQKLYYHTFPRRWLTLAVRLMPLFRQDPRRMGQNKDIDLVALSGENFPVHAWIDYREVMALKEAASACHASQTGMVRTGGLLRWVFRVTSGRDTYMRAYPPPEPGMRERDLFAGLDGL